MTVVLHVVPDDDLAEHDTETEEADCVCCPDVECFDDGGRIITHHSLDSGEPDG